MSRQVDLLTAIQILMMPCCSGLGTSVLNVSLTIFPMVVASITASDPSWTKVEFFFVVCSLMGVIVGILLYIVDRQSWNGLLEASEASAESLKANKGYAPLVDDEEAELREFGNRNPI